MEHQDKTAPCKCHQRSQKSFWKEWARDVVWHIPGVSPVHVTAAALQPLRGDLSAARGHLVQKHCKTQLSRMNWMWWWLQFIILKNRLRRCEEDDALTTAEINCFSRRSLGPALMCHKCRAGFHTGKTALTLQLGDGEATRTTAGQETHCKRRACSIFCALSVP